jgi:hypothetical protein
MTDKKRRQITGTQRVQLIDGLRDLANEDGMIDQIPSEIAKLMSKVIGQTISSAVVKKQMGDLGLSHRPDTTTPIARVAAQLNDQETRIAALEEQLRKTTDYLGLD